MLRSSASRARAQSKTDYDCNIQLDESISAAEAAKLLKLDVSRVRQRLRDCSLFGIKHENRWRLVVQDAAVGKLIEQTKVVHGFRPFSARSGIVQNAGLGYKNLGLPVLVV
jgi:hypothetical protein